MASSVVFINTKRDNSNNHQAGSAESDCEDVLAYFNLNSGKVNHQNSNDSGNSSTFADDIDTSFDVSPIDGHEMNNRQSNNSTDERNSLHDEGNNPLSNTSNTREHEACSYKQHAQTACDPNESSANEHTPDDNESRNKQYTQADNGSSDTQNTISNVERDSDFTIATKEMNNRQSNNSTDERNSLHDEGNNPLSNTLYTREHEACSNKQHAHSVLDPNESSDNEHTPDDNESRNKQYTQADNGSRDTQYTKSNNESDSDFTNVTKEMNNRQSNNSSDEGNSFQKLSPKLHDEGNNPLGSTSYTREHEPCSYKQHTQSVLDPIESSYNGHTPDDNESRNKQYTQSDNGSSDTQNTISNDESDSDFTNVTKEMNYRQSKNSTDERNNLHKLFPKLHDEGQKLLGNTSYTRDPEACSHKQHAQSDPHECIANEHTADDDEIKNKQYTQDHNGSRDTQNTKSNDERDSDLTIVTKEMNNRQSKNSTDERNSLHKLFPKLHDEGNKPLGSTSYTREHEACSYRQHAQTACDPNESSANGYTSVDNESRNKQYNGSSDTQNTISNDESDSESATVTKELFLVGKDRYDEGNTSKTREHKACSYKQHACDPNESSANGHTLIDKESRNKQYAQYHNGSSDTQNAISIDESDSDFTINIVTKEVLVVGNDISNPTGKMVNQQHGKLQVENDNATCLINDDITSNSFGHDSCNSSLFVDDIDTSFDVSHIYGHKKKNRQSNTGTHVRSSFQKLSPKLHDEGNSSLCNTLFTREHEAYSYKRQARSDSNESSDDGHTSVDNEIRNKQYAQDNNGSSDTQNTKSNDESDSESETVPKEVSVVGNDFFNPTCHMVNQQHGGLQVENDIASCLIDPLDDDKKSNPYGHDTCNGSLFSDDMDTSFDVSPIYGHKMNNRQSTNMQLDTQDHNESSDKQNVIMHDGGRSHKHDTGEHDESINMQHTIAHDGNTNQDASVLVYKRSNSEAISNRNTGVLVYKRLNSNLINGSDIDCDDLLRGISSICGEAVEDLKENTTHNNKESNDEKRKSGIDWMKILSEIIEILYNVYQTKPDSESGINQMVIYWIEVAQKIASILYRVFKEWL